MFFHWKMLEERNSHYLCFMPTQVDKRRKIYDSPGFYSPVLGNILFTCKIKFEKYLM